MTPASTPFGWCAYHFHASDLHLIVTLTVLFEQATAAGAMIGDGLSDRFAVAIENAASAVGLPAEAVVPVTYEASPESVRRHALAALDEARGRGYAGLWLVLSPVQGFAEPESWDTVDLAWTHLTEHYPISALFVLPFDDRGDSPSAVLRRRHAYYYSAGQLIRA